MDAGSSLFINPVGAMENINDTGSEYETLLDAGIEIYSQGISGQLHHKYAIGDHSQALSDPTVVTGSHNWSTTAETTNDENTLIIHDERVANLCYQEFTGLLNGMGVGITEAATMQTTAPLSQPGGRSTGCNGGIRNRRMAPAAGREWSFGVGAPNHGRPHASTSVT